MSYPLPSIHKTATPISAISNEYHLAYRSNSTPMLSASFSFSSFSSSSSNEEELLLQKGSVDLDSQQADNNKNNEPLVPKKSASMSYISEPNVDKRKKRMSMAQQKSSLKLNQLSDQKITKKKQVSISSSSDSLSYYLARQQLSDADEYEEELDEESSSTTLNTSSSSSRICKKGRNVDKACNHCKRSHLRCDNVRPCRRCVATGKVGCQDVKHKPRGRPRLQKKRSSVTVL